MTIDLLDRCIQTSQKIKENKKLLQDLNFEINNNTIKYKLIPLFRDLKTKVDHSKNTINLNS
jgi:hypothetical protein